MLSTGVSTTVKVAEFMDVATGEHFDTTVMPTQNGPFVVDEEVVSIVGPFFKFPDGVVGIFKGIYERSVV